MLLLSDEMEIVDEVVMDEDSELVDGKVGEEGDRVEEELLDVIITESSGSIIILSFFRRLLILGNYV